MTTIRRRDVNVLEPTHARASISVSPAPERPGTSQARTVPVSRGLGAMASFRRATTTSSADGFADSTANNFTASPSTVVDAMLNGDTIDAGQIYNGFSLLAREYLAVGFYEGAQLAAQKENDLLALAAALALGGNPTKACAIIEAALIVALVKEHQKLRKPSVFVKKSSAVPIDFKRVFRALAEPQNPKSVEYLTSIPVPTEEEFAQVNAAVCAHICKAEVHLWYLIAVLLQHDYHAPTIPFVRMFFNMISTTEVGARRDERRQSKRRGTKISQTVVISGTESGSSPAQGRGSRRLGRALTRNEAEDALIAGCSDEEVQVVQAYVSFVLRRYRSAIEATSEVLRIFPDDFSMRFLRCFASMVLGDRRTAVEDCTTLTRSASRFVCAAGLSIATYALPNPNALEALREIALSKTEEVFVYCLGEWAHGLVLLQKGEFAAARECIAQPLKLQNQKTRLQTWLLEVEFICNIALKDISALLQAPLPPLRELHLSLVNEFGGGFDNPSFQRIEMESPVGRLLNPPNALPSFVDARHAIVYFFMKARSLYSFGRLREAWPMAMSAASAAEELIGGYDYCFSDCAPHKVFFFTINVGLALLEKIIEEGGNEEVDPRDHGAVRKRQQEDALGDSIVRLCRTWGRKLRYYHPQLIAGYCAVAQVSIAAQDPSSIDRAATIADTFPDSVLAQNLVSYALFSKHLIPDAISSARRTLHRFPHVQEVRTMFRAISDNVGTYAFFYRSVVPITFMYGDTEPIVVRTVAVVALTVLNLVILIFVAIMNNLSAYIPQLLEDTSSRVQVPFWAPSVAGGIVVIYAIFSTLLPRSLLTFIFSDLHFRDTKLQRALFALRGIGYVNIANAALVWRSGNGFLLENVWSGFPVLIVALLCLLQFPLSTRVFFLRSLDEPSAGFTFWLTMALVDLITYIGLIPLHALLAIGEPISFLLFFFFMPSVEVEESGSVKQRLERALAKPRKRWIVGSGSRFVHLLLLRLLYMDTHSDLHTKYALKQQEEDDDMRVFPMIFLLESVPLGPLPPPAERRKNAWKQADNEEADTARPTTSSASVARVSMAHTDVQLALAASTILGEDDGDDWDASFSDVGDSLRPDAVVRTGSLRAAMGREKGKAGRKAFLDDDLFGEFVSDDSDEERKDVAAHAPTGGEEPKKTIGDVFVTKANAGDDAIFFMGGMRGRFIDDHAATDQKEADINKLNATWGRTSALPPGPHAGPPLLDSLSDDEFSPLQSRGGTPRPASGGASNRPTSAASEGSAPPSRGGSPACTRRKSVTAQLRLLHAKTERSGSSDHLGVPKEATPQLNVLRPPSSREGKPPTPQSRLGSPPGTGRRPHSREVIRRVNSTRSSDPHSGNENPLSQPSSRAASREMRVRQKPSASLSHQGSGTSLNRTNGSSTNGSTTTAPMMTPVDGAPSLQKIPSLAALNNTSGEAVDDRRRSPPPLERKPSAFLSLGRNGTDETAHAYPLPARQVTRTSSINPPLNRTTSGRALQRTLSGTDRSAKGDTERKGSARTRRRRPDTSPDPSAGSRRRTHGSTALSEEATVASLDVSSGATKMLSPHSNHLFTEGSSGGSGKYPSPTNADLRRQLQPHSAGSSAATGHGYTDATAMQQVVQPEAMRRLPSSNGTPTSGPTSPPPTGTTRSPPPPQSDINIQNRRANASSSDEEAEQKRVAIRRRGNRRQSRNAASQARSSAPSDAPDDTDEAATSRTGSKGVAVAKMKAVTGMMRSNSTARSVAHSVAHSVEKEQYPRRPFVPAEDDSAIPIVNANIKIRKVIDDFRLARQMANSMMNKEQLQKQQTAAKLTFVHSVLRIGQRISVETFDSKRQLLAIFEDLLAEGDGLQGNVELLNCLLNVVASLDLPSLIEHGDKHVECVSKGYYRYAEVILRHRGVQAMMTTETVEKLLVALLKLTGVARRVAVLRAIIKGTETSVPCRDEAAAITPMFQSALEQVIASGNTPINFAEYSQEELAYRCDLVMLAARHPFIEFSFAEAEANDRQTIFSRACREGDVNLVSLIIKSNRVPDINRVQSDGTNSLQQAAARNHVAVVEFLLRQKNIEPSLVHVFPGKGTAIVIATQLNRDERIVRLLREKTEEMNRRAAGGDDVGFANGMSPGGAGLADRGGKKAPDGSAQVRVLLATLKPLYDRLRRLEAAGGGGALVGESGLSMDQLREINALKSTILQAKANMTTRIGKIGDGDVRVERDDVRGDLLQLIGTLVDEGDQVDSNMALLVACFRHFGATCDLKTVAVERRWISKAAENGSFDYVRLFLELPAMSRSLCANNGNATCDIITSAAVSRMYRVPMLLMLMTEFKGILCYSSFKEALASVWQSGAEDVLSARRANVAEIRDKLPQLTAALLRDWRRGDIIVDFSHTEGRDRRTIFGRACAEGNAPLIHELVGAGAIMDGGAAMGDGSTPLSLAVESKSVEAVKALVQHGLANVDAIIPKAGKTALQLADTLGLEDISVALAVA